jgi:F-box-like
MSPPDQQVVLRPDGMSTSARYKSLFICKTGRKPPCRISIGHLPDELLLEIFDLWRLADLCGWNHERQWYTLLHICRRWRYIMLESASRLKLRLLCDHHTPTETMLMHSPPLPLIVEPTYIDRADIIEQSQQNAFHGLGQSDRVFSIILSADSLYYEYKLKLNAALNRTFPILETLSLTSFEDDIPMILPDNFATPRLRALHLHNIPLEDASLVLTNSVTANLISLRFDRIEEYSYVPPEHLLELISSMPQLENLSIGFGPTFLLSDPDREFWHADMHRVVLPSLWNLTFTGDSAYLEKLLARISAPLLQCFHVTYSPKPSLAVKALPAFLKTIQDIDFRAAVVSFSGTVAITYYPEKPSDSSSCLMLAMGSDDKIDRFNEQVATMVQICTAISPVLRFVESLAIEFNRAYVPDDFAVRREHWCIFLRSLGAVRRLRADVALTRELVRTLNPEDGMATEELLPMLSELVVVSRVDLVRNPFDSLIHTRSLVGYDIDFQVIEFHPLPPPPLCILQYPDSFECSI